MKKIWCAMVVGTGLLTLASGAWAEVNLYSNSCDELTNWNDCSSGTMSTQSGGPSGTFVHFIGNGNATMALYPNGSAGVAVKAGNKLVFAAKGYAQDFCVNLTIDGTWYNLTGVPGNQWIYLSSDWQTFELTLPVDGLVNCIGFNVWGVGHEINIDDLKIVDPYLTAVFSDPGSELTNWRDCGSGTMSVQNNGSETYVHFVGTENATLALYPNAGGTSGVDISAGDKLVVDVKGYAQDFNISLTIDGTWYYLTGPASNPWIVLDGTAWHRLEYAFPVSGKVGAICFSVWMAGQEINVDNVTIFCFPQVATPVFSPNYGVISGPRNVAITCATEGATIRYTTNGTEPTETSDIYTAAVGVDHNVTLKAKAFAEHYAPSLVKSVTYTVPATLDRPAAIDYNSNAVGVDGDLAEWPAGDFIILDKNYDRNPTDVAEAYYAARWNSNGKIYVAVKVRDTSHAFTTTYTGWDARDGVEVYLHTQGTAGSYYGTWEVAQQYMAGIKAGTTNEVWTSMSDLGTLTPAAGLQAAGKVVGEWIYYEFALTAYDYFGGYTSKPNVVTTLNANDIVGLDVVVASNNSSFTYTGMKSENERGNKSYDWTQFGLHKLVVVNPITPTPTPTPTPSSTPGDANGDGRVDVSDLGILAAHYGATAGATWATGDFNNDGKVDVSDLGILAANYGFGTGTALDFNQDAAALGLSTDAKAETPATTGLGCGSVGLPLVAGLLLAGMLVCGSLKMKD